MVQFWTIFAAAFLASAVEFVEAFTIVLVIGVTVNWRSSFLGMGAALVALAVIVGGFGVGLIRVIPIEALRLVVGVLLLLFGLKWLKKALLRYSGLKAVHDEEAIYEAQLEELKFKGIVRSKRLDPFGVVTSFKSVLLEGLEVAFIASRLSIVAFQHRCTRHFSERSTQCRALDAKMAFQQPNTFPQLISNRPNPLHQHSLGRNRLSLN